VAVDCMKQGATDYLLKDRLARLGQAVNQALEQQRLRAEKLRGDRELRHSEKRFRALIEHSSDGIALVDAQANVLYASPSTSRILGYAPDEFVGRNAFDWIHADDRAYTGELVAQLLQEPGGNVFAQFRFRHKDGSWLWIEALGNNLLAEPSVRAIVVNYRDITGRKRAEEQIKASLREKEVLLREIHHRVKNNLQVVSSLLMLQSRSIKDPQACEMFRESLNRVKSMALIHEKLYGSKDLARVDIAEYIRSLTPHLCQSLAVGAGDVSLKIDAEDVFVGIDTAVPCGLLINELVSNSLKHAFPMGKGGEIHIDFRSERDKRYALTVRDNGVGFPSHLDFRNTDSLGLQLVTALTNQLGASIELTNGVGTTFKITFEEQCYQKRG
jgi:PAS domain S-box-containing protein